MKALLQDWHDIAHYFYFDDDDDDGGGDDNTKTAFELYVCGEPSSSLWFYIGKLISSAWHFHLHQNEDRESPNEREKNTEKERKIDFAQFPCKCKKVQGNPKINSIFFPQSQN